MMNPKTPAHPFVLALFGLALVAPAAARQPEAGTATATVRIARLDRHPATPAAARRVLVRIDRALLEVCGASDFSLREVKAATRQSACWKDGMADAVARIGDPALRLAYAQRP